MGEITQLLERARDGEPAAWEQAVASLYEDLLRMARRARAHGGAATLNPTALVNECYLRVARRQADGIHSREHFLAIAGRAMRQILVNYARDRVAAKRGGGALQVTLDEDTLSAQHEADDLLALDAALNQLATEDVRLARIVDCRIFSGLTEQETAEALNLPLRSVQRLWHDARERLRHLLPD
ncbi:MAG TPA: ECF-type sigma factor [Thermomonas sp.]|jgi:RNA polymerase sigma factor (TIGR02999 family)|uniref:ECF-type sigma factor n=1 Tax=Thermomonas sp. TaxID=1971895 RepID=UPI002B9E1713|nr:ECF-type sigma factor [Thermomonas sp.]HOV96005.1 ECF-type sigma factor [Thermomonas sp.]